MDFSLVELVGYLASIIVLCSFLMKDVKKLRIVNILGCFMFVVYGFMMPSVRLGLPIIITNLAIMLVNCYYLLVAKKS